MEPEDESIYDLRGSSGLPTRKKLIINAALTGNVPMKADNPNVPITPEEVAEDASRCFKAGATFFHLHIREEDGKPSCRKELFEETISKVRKRCPGAVVCVTTSGRIFKNFEERSAALNIEGELKPDFASLTLGSVNFPKETAVYPPDKIEQLAEIMAAKGIRPELEVFDTGMVNYAVHLAKKGKLKQPFYFNMFFGILGTMPGRMVDLCHLVHSLPRGSHWAAAGGGRFQLPVNTAAILMGGHVRVGLEDNIYYDFEKTTLATNEMLVKRVARIASEIGRPIASCSETRTMLGL